MNYIGCKARIVYEEEEKSMKILYTTDTMVGYSNFKSILEYDWTPDLFWSGLDNFEDIYKCPANPLSQERVWESYDEVKI
jgi:hypothetical protein